MRIFRRMVPRKVHVILFFSVIGIITFALSVLPRTFEALSRIDDTITAAEHTMKLLVDMETGQRGFLVAGKQKFLEPYVSGKRDLPDSFNRLAGLVNGDAALGEHLKQARTLAEQWQTRAAAEIEQRRMRPDFSLTFDPDTGKTLMDTIRGRFAAIIKVAQDRRTAVVRRAEEVFLLLLSTAGIALFAILWSAADATELQDQIERMQELEQLVDHAHDAIIVRDPESRVLTWNTGATRLYGYTQEEARGRVTHELFQTKTPIGRAELEKEGRDSWEGRLEHRDRKNAELVVESRQVLTRTTDASHKPKALLEINRDITKDVNLIRDLNHDLRNRLSEIGVWTYNAIHEASFDIVKRQLNIVQAAAFHMKLILDDMVANYEGRSNKETVSVEDLCRNLNPQLIRPKLDQSQSYNFHIHCNCERDLVLMTDRPKLFRCLFNLLVNAFKHAHAQNIVLQITPTVNRHVIFAVIDDGDGIPEAMRPLLTIANWRGRSAAGAGGMGRGLSIAQQYAELLGGSLRYEPEYPHGSRFELLIPVSYDGGRA